MNTGKLPDAVTTCKEMEVSLTDVPPPLVHSNVLADLMVRAVTFVSNL